MNIPFLRTPMVYISDEALSTPLPPCPAIHPECFCMTTDRHVYMAAFIQEFEDAAHLRENTAVTRDALTGIGWRWLGPVLRFWSFRDVEINAAGNGASVSLRVDFPSESEIRRFAQYEPVLSEFLNTPDGMCACQHVPGVIHSHG
jgi:hypothetical protein